MKKYAIGCGVLLLAMISGCSVFFHILGNNLVEYEVLSRHYSPNGEQMVVFYTSAAGATTPMFMSVAIMPSDENEYTKKKYLALGLNHVYEIQVHWQDDANVNIMLPRELPESEVILKQDEVLGIQITYIEPAEEN